MFSQPGMSHFTPVRKSLCFREGLPGNAPPPLERFASDDTCCVRLLPKSRRRGTLVKNEDGIKAGRRL